MIDFAAARANMVECQVRPNDVTDMRIQQAMARIPREAFLPRSQQSLAYMGEHVPVGEGRFLLEPRCFAKLLQAARIDPSDAVLDIGCATGYSSAVLADLADAVVGLECDQELARMAGEALAEMGVDNAAVMTTDLAGGCPDQGTFDVIFLNGAIEIEPSTLLDQLKDGGRLVAVLAGKTGNHACLFTKTVHGGEEIIDKQVVFDASSPVLPGFERPEKFVF